ncbi:hypothetical protein [Streptomyces chartreusis]|uniref:hypothetical protein n=1 Tax=Streptomyces chartreusis TaxID=1969 RepID=UPI00362F5C7F
MMAVGAPASAAEFSDNGGTPQLRAPQLANMGPDGTTMALQWAINGVEADFEDNDDRTAFTQTMANQMKAAAGPQYNAMVFNVEDQKYLADLAGGPMPGDRPFTATARYDGETYGLWVFKEGDFANLGDGGYENWAFEGTFDREENSGLVEFEAPYRSVRGNEACTTNLPVLDDSPCESFD